MVIKEAQRSFTYLNIYDFNVDAIIVNRVVLIMLMMITHGMERYTEEALDEIVQSFQPIPIYYASLKLR